MRFCIVGHGAFAQKHLDGLARIEGTEVVSLVGRTPEGTNRVADKYQIPHRATDLAEALTQDIDAVIITSPTQVHAQQAEQVMRAGKHVQIEIPIADSLSDARRIQEVQKETGVVAMAGHTRRYNPSHQWIQNKIQVGELAIQQLVAQTFFFRRSNINLEGNPRSWVDHLLWHHACHTVDLFQYQTGEVASEVFALQGPMHPELGIAMDMNLGLKVPSGATCSLALSFNNDGPQGTFFRYICDNGTYLARYDDLVDGKENPIDVSSVDVAMDGIELQDREFVSSIQEQRESRSSVDRVLPAMETLDRLQKCF